MLDQLIDWRISLMHHLISFQCGLRLGVSNLFAGTTLLALVRLSLWLFRLRSTTIPALDLDAIDAERLDRLCVRRHGNGAFILWDRQYILLILIINVISHANWVDEQLW